ncbi:hypothetical protein [Marivirga harenae]|uniref:hypothetical protein n=1 Tax=Marivirga harenae TaxID=2010992 RepID=UPI0026E08AC7|nr:hypothetical protein [Marivirga harenae]WKV10935.1 hypothetical protein Q3Y49_12000 [Marivirga harenae]
MRDTAKFLIGYCTFATELTRPLPRNSGKKEGGQNSGPACADKPADGCGMKHYFVLIFSFFLIK